MSKKVIQFGYNVKIPQGVPVVDCRCLPNPFGMRDQVAARHKVVTHPRFRELVDQAIALLHSHDTIGIGCGYGVHRSALVVAKLEFEFDDPITVEKIGKRP